MKSYKIEDNKIKLHNILYAITSTQDYEMNRLLLLENMPDTDEEYVLAEGYHCSCYDFDDTAWDCIQLSLKELNKILKEEKYDDLRIKLRSFLKYYN